jgi:hypothetical protein
MRAGFAYRNDETCLTLRVRLVPVPINATKVPTNPADRAPREHVAGYAHLQQRVFTARSEISYTVCELAEKVIAFRHLATSGQQASPRARTRIAKPSEAAGQHEA